MDHQKAFSRLPHLGTERLILRPVQLNDAPAVFKYSQDPQMTRYTRWMPHCRLEDSIFFIEQILAQYAAGKPAPWAVVLKEGKQMIGTTGFVHWSPIHARGEIGYAIGRQWWGNGYALEAARAALAFGFKTLRCNRIEAMCDVANLSSARVMEKLGMRFEGVLRQYLYMQDSHRDVRIYSLLFSEWGGK
ncbi:MAG: GNAT family N-acetyltransferase [Anaerolineaceae bacterium]|nr:GNAT family N-acetyltransferase [Anaerolineaceae bacterium]